MQITTIREDDVIWCYRTFLGRDPESPTAVQSHLSIVNDFRALVLRFIRSPEFRRKVSPPDLLPLSRSEMNIEITASATDLHLILNRIREAWTQMGQVRPHHSVLTREEYRPEAVDAESIERFYASGVEAASTVTPILKRYGFANLESKICVEYGCGLGRVTLALARIFRKVHGYDISSNHLALAERRASDSGVHNIDFHLCSADFDVDSLENCDFFYSFIVFQHNPPPIIRELIAAALRSLRGGGIAIFQVPVYLQGYSFKVREYLARRRQSGMEMHCIPQEVVFSLITECGCRTLEVRESAWDRGISNTFVVKRLGGLPRLRRQLSGLIRPVRPGLHGV